MFLADVGLRRCRLVFLVRVSIQIAELGLKCILLRFGLVDSYSKFRYMFVVEESLCTFGVADNFEMGPG